MAPNQVTLAYESEDLDHVTSFQKRGYRTTPIFFCNGKRVPNKLAQQARSNQTLLSFIREVLHLKGSKLGCAEGGCGACTVMISKTDPNEPSKIRHVSVNACLMPILAADGCHITTVEGVGSIRKTEDGNGTQLHPVQKAMTELHGSQCGFCTPGIIVSIYTLLTNARANAHDHVQGAESVGDPDSAHSAVNYMEEHLDGNLCRCTGYRPIWDAARSLCDDALEDGVIHGPCGTACHECPEHDTCTQDCNEQSKQGGHGRQQNTASTNTKSQCCSSSSLDKAKLKHSFIQEHQTNTWKTQADDMFPQELLTTSPLAQEQLSKPLMVVDRSEYHAAGTWFKPTTFAEVLKLLQQFGIGGCKLVVGNTEVGIETRFKHAVYPRLVAPSDRIQELFSVTYAADRIDIGACTPLSTIQHEFERPSDTDEESALFRTVRPIHDMLRWFASTQIRNVACLGGNLVTASPISDMNPMLACYGSVLVLSKLDVDDGSSIQRRRVLVSEFFLKYRTVNLDTAEAVEKIEVPLVQPIFEYVCPFKQARRREDDISIVTSGMRIKLAVENGQFMIQDACIAFGGMAPTTVIAKTTCQQLIGSPFTPATFTDASEVLLQELKLPMDVPGGQAAYRMSLAASYLHKMYLFVCERLQKDVSKVQADPARYPDVASPLPETPILESGDKSGTDNFLTAAKPSYRGVQTYPKPKKMLGLEDTESPIAPGSMAPRPTSESLASKVGKPVTHQSGALHCTGEAVYVDDMPLPQGTLQASLVLTKECGSTMKSIDKAPAMEVPGVVDVYTAEDIAMLGGKNVMGPIAKDEFVFLPVGDMVRTVGQVVGVVVAETLEAAELGARCVVVDYDEQKAELPVSIEDAIAASSFYEMTRHAIQRGDVQLLDQLSTRTGSGNDTNGRKDSETTTHNIGDTVEVSGSFRSGAQEHFYLETNGTLAVPTDSNTNLTIYASTQAPTKTQMFCASTTGTRASKVVCRVKRMGGGFGGKETRSVFASCAAAVAAKRSCRPVRLILPRDVDMATSGTRHTFLSTYNASAVMTKDGPKILAMDIQLYNNAGWAMDLSGPVADRALFHVDNVYNIPNLRATAVCCKTAVAANTAFRGFGGPQGMAAVEHVMDHLASSFRIPIDVFRRSNMYRVGDSTHFGTVIGDDNISGKWNVPSMWDCLHEELQYEKLNAQVKEFNSKNKWLKRGLCLLPTKFGIAFTAKFMNQGGALVHVYTDGTVLVSHGGTEMGQGLHTKVCQVAAQAFGIPIDDVYVNDSSTDKVANTIPTAASMSTDMYGMATLDACRQILARLGPIQHKLGVDASFAEIANAAFMERIDLSAHGFFTLDDARCGYDFTKPKPDGVKVAPAATAVTEADGVPENSWKGQPFNYFTQGVAFSQVEIDVLTGNHKTIRSDCLVDVGSSINPSIDIGQIEGAFIQGMGWSTMEEVVYADDDHTWVRPRARMFTTGPGTYKIPAFNDVPETFNVSLQQDVDNPFAVHSSKAVGEPPFFLGSSVFYAIKDAVQSARRSFGNAGYFEMRMPATSERIRLHCCDAIARAAIDKACSGAGGSSESAESGGAETYQPQGSY